MWRGTSAAVRSMQGEAASVRSWGLWICAAAQLVSAIAWAGDGQVASTATTPSGGELSKGEIKICVKRFTFRGNHVFSDAQLAALPEVRKHIGTKEPIGIIELEQVRQAITQHYIDAGYINSGAVLPEQALDDPEHAIVRIDIVEGTLTEISLTQEGFNPGHTCGGKAMLSRDYVLDRVKLGQRPPLNVRTLNEQLEILRQDTNVARLNAQLRPGSKPGEATLDLNVAETNPFQLGLEFNNKRSPSVGGERFYALASDSNLTGHGDNLFVRYGITKGGLDDMRLAGVDDVSVGYTLPLNPYGTTLELSYVRTDDLVIENPFKSVNITSETQSGAITLRQSLYRSTASQLAVSASLLRRENWTYLMGQPFSFSPGAPGGHSVVTAVAFGQEWLTRTERETFALRSTFTIGLDALGSTVTSDGKNDSRFLIWLGQAQYVRRLWADSELILRCDAQLADNPLPAVEQISIGGFDTVRGYRENRLVRDNGIIGSAEWRIPILRKASRPILDFAPFIDSGYGWNFHGDKSEPPTLISSAGVGLLYNPNRHVSIQVYYGYAFKHFKNSNDVQDHGLHFDLVLLAF